MEVIKKYTAIQIDRKEVDRRSEVQLSYGDIEISYGYREYPDEEFDTEQQAIEHAFKTSPYAKWLIIPVIKFNNL